VYRIVDTDYERTLRRLGSGVVETDSASYLLTRAEVHALNDQPALARAAYDSARAILEDKTKAQPERADLHSLLGVAYAGLGRKEEAIREAEEAVELLPATKDHLAGPDWIAFLAEVYVMVGEHDAAIDQLEYLLSIPGWLTIPWLQVDPIWDPLRDHPRFQALLEHAQ
jgi:serine/threonine-protein kinase